jgi:hypothetical protein
MELKMANPTMSARHRDAATLVLRLANTGLADEMPLRRLLDDYRNGKSSDPADFDLLLDICDVLSIDVRPQIDGRAIDPDRDSWRTIGALPLEHWL